MVGTRRNNNNNNNNVGASSDPGLRDLIASEIGETLQEILPGLVNQMMEEIGGVIDKKIAEAMRGVGSSSGSQLRFNNFKEFSACQPPLFHGKRDPLVTTRWISEVEGAFHTSFCTPEVKVLYAANLLRGAAKDWWDLTIKFLSEEEIMAMSWDDFKKMFKEKYMTPIDMERVTKEFLALEQTTETVDELTDKFLEKSLFCPDYVANERMKMDRYKNALRTDIREFVVTARCQTFKEMVDVALIRELELETQESKKRKPQVTQTTSTPDKKFKLTIPKVEAKREYPKCNKCGKNHFGECRLGMGVCYKCGKPGHMSKDCKEIAKLCFGCHEYGHFKSECPKGTGSTVQAPATATLRITDGKDGRA